jgi:hypothetical protein
MLGISSRIIAASALTSVVPDPADRGAFMAVNSSIQQLAGGVASAAGGLVVTETASGALVHYDTLGYVVVGAMVVAMALLHSVNRAVAAKLAAAPVRASGAA